MFDFILTEEQKMLRTTIRDFVTKEVTPRAAALDREPDPRKAFPWDIIEASNKIGLRHLALSEKYGGTGQDSLTMGICLEELAVGDLGVAVIFAQHWKWVQLLQRLGTEEQCKKYLIPLRDDPRGLMALGVSEPESGSDFLWPCPDPKAGPKMSAKKDGDYVILNGTKRFISNGAVAHLYIILARTDNTVPCTQGMTMFIIPRDLSGSRNLAGFTIGEVYDKIGERLSENAELVFDNCRVPMANMLGQWNKGATDIGQILRQSNSYAGASTLGVAWAAFEKAFEFTKERVQGTVPIIQHANVAAKLGEMYGMLRAAQLMVRKGCWQADHPEQLDPVLLRCVKPFCADVSMKVTLECLQLQGGLGAMRDVGAEKLVRDAIMFLHSDGTQDILNRGNGDLLGRIGYQR